MVQYFVIKLYLITCFRGTYEHLYQNIISRHKCLRTFPICTRKDVNFGRVEKLLWKFLHDPYSGYQVWSSVYFFHSVTCVSLCMGGSVLVTWSIPTYARNFLKICILFCRYDFSWVSSLQNIPNDLWYREGENELIYNEYMLRKSLRQWYKSKMLYKSKMCLTFINVLCIFLTLFENSFDIVQFFTFLVHILVNPYWSLNFHYYVVEHLTCWSHKFESVHLHVSWL